MTASRHAELAIHPLDAEDSEGAVDPHTLLQRQQVLRRLRWMAVGVLVLLALGAGRTVYWRMGNARALEAVSQAQAITYVRTARPEAGPASREVVLPGTLQTQNEANLYARSQGYVKRLHADIGQRVKAGQVLAEIDTPELDEQLRQAKADEATGRANEELARATATRSSWASQAR